MKRHSILYLNHAAYIGGAEVALLNLLTYLDRKTYSPIAFVPEGELAAAIRKLDIRCVPIPSLAGLNRYNLPRFVYGLARLMKSAIREQPALIHANTNFASEYAGLLAKWLKIPTIGHIRDIEPLGRMGQYTIRQNTRLIAISDAVTRYLIEEHIPETQIVRIYDGVDLRQYVPISQPPPPERFIIGIIGQIGTRKGHVYLLEAVKRLLPHHPNLHVWIIGKEPQHSAEQYAEQLQHIVEHTGMRQQVEFLGFRTDIPAILAQIDVLALPSLQEPFGKIVIEAMAMGKPVVASRVGGVPEIVEDGVTGILIPPADAAALASALRKLIANRDTRETMGREGRQRVEKLFSLEENVRQTEHLYEHFL